MQKVWAKVLITKQDFKKLKLLDPRYVLPGRKHLSHTALPKLYAECREKVEEGTYFATTTTDLWYIVLIIVIEWKKKKSSLEFEEKRQF